MTLFEACAVGFVGGYATGIFTVLFVRATLRNGNGNGK